MDDWKQDRIASALDGTNPTVLARMRSGFAVFGDTQFLPGYCVLLRCPAAACLNDLEIDDRAQFLTDMTIIGDAIGEVCRPWRLNYEILGNSLPLLHAHVFPRYQWEEDARRSMPVWLYPPACWSEPKYQFDQPEFDKLKTNLRQALAALMRS